MANLSDLVPMYPDPLLISANSQLAIERDVNGSQVQVGSWQVTMLGGNILWVTNNDDKVEFWRTTADIR